MRMRIWGSCAALLFLLSGAAFAWFGSSAAAQGGTLAAGRPTGGLELWVQLPGAEGGFAAVGEDAFARSAANRMEEDAAFPLPDGGALYLIAGAEGAPEGNALLDAAIAPGTSLARRLLVRNRREDASVGFALTFPAPEDGEGALAEALLADAFLVTETGLTAQFCGTDGLGLRSAGLCGAVPPGEWVSFELRFFCASGGSGRYHADVVLDARGAFSGLHAVSTGEELFTLLESDRLKNGDTVLLCGNVTVEHLITDRAFNLMLAGYTLEIEGAFAVNRPLDGDGGDLFATMEVGGGLLRVNGSLPVRRDGAPESVRFSLNCPGTAVRWTVAEGSDTPRPGAGELNVRAFNGLYGEAVTDAGLGSVSAETR